MSLLDDVMFDHVVFDSDPSHITNFDKDQLYLYHQAIKKDLIDNDPEYSLEIRKDAFCIRGKLIPSCYALHISGVDRRNLDLTDFWNIFWKIKKEAEAAVK